MEHRLEQEIAQWVHHEGLIQQPIEPWADALTSELHLAPQLRIKSPKTMHYFLIDNSNIPFFSVHLPAAQSQPVQSPVATEPTNPKPQHRGAGEFLFSSLIGPDRWSQG